MAERLLVSATINRPDLIALFAPLAGRAELHFVEYDDHWGRPLDPDRYAPVGTVSRWSQHASAERLLGAIAPDRVALLAINSREQVALRAAARRRGIEVLHVEHGYRMTLPDTVAGPRAARAGAAIQPGLRRHGFFARSLSEAPAGDGARLLAYAAESVRGMDEHRLRRHAALRRPDRYVSFAPACFAYHQRVDRVPPALAAATRYVGVPTFDAFAPGPGPPQVETDTVLLIDHQLHNAGIAGWDEEFHRRWAAEVHRVVVREGGRRLLVKEHPGDRSDAWAPFLDQGVTRLDSIDAVAAALGRVGLVLGGATTLQLPAAARDHVVLLALEIHPRAEARLADPFVTAGIAHPVTSWAELARALAERDALAVRQAPHKPAFTERFLHRLDGRAGARLAEAVIN